MFCSDANNGRVERFVILAKGKAWDCGPGSALEKNLSLTIG